MCPYAAAVLSLRKQGQPCVPQALAGLGAQTLAALCAAACQHLTAILGGHTCAEAVAALADQTARLIRTLHCILRAADHAALGSMNIFWRKHSDRFGTSARRTSLRPDAYPVVRAYTGRAAASQRAAGEKSCVGSLTPR